MLESFRDYFFALAPWVIMLPVLATIPLRSVRAYRMLWWYLLLAVISQCIGLICWWYKINNLPMLHVFTLLEFGLLYRFFVLRPGIISPTWVYPIAALMLLASLIDVCWVAGLFAFNTLSRACEALIFISLCSLWFMRDLTGEQQSLRGDKYLVGGLFVYFSGSLVLFAFGNVTIRLGRDLALNLWSFHTLLLVLFYLLWYRGFHLIKKNT